MGLFFMRLAGALKLFSLNAIYTISSMWLVENYSGCHLFTNPCSKCMEKWKFNIYWLTQGPYWKMNSGIFKMYQNSNLMTITLASYVMPLSMVWSGVTFTWAYKYNYSFKKKCKWQRHVSSAYTRSLENGKVPNSHTQASSQNYNFFYWFGHGGIMHDSMHSLSLKKVENFSMWCI